MSEQMPRKALAALLPPSIPIEGTHEVVRPFTLATFAVLERIGSPLLAAGGPAPDALALLPSLYAACRGPAAALESDNLLRDAVRWADALPPRALGAIDAAARRQIARVLDVAPQAKKAPGTPDTTATSRPSPSTPAANSASAGEKRSPTSPQPRSRS